MVIHAIKTNTISSKEDIHTIIDRYLYTISDNSILVISSKILSIMQDDVIAITENKKKLIRQECEYYLPDEYNKYGANITITGHKLVGAAGIDESNVDSVYVLLPSHVQKTANSIRSYCMNKFSISNFGVLVTDSRTLPLNIGTYSDAIAYSGVSAVRDYRGTKDLYGRTFKAERQNLVTSLATAANVVMGEGRESCPIAIISDLPSDIFVSNPPTKDELAIYYFDKKDDFYENILHTSIWQKGGGGYLARQ